LRLHAFRPVEQLHGFVMSPAAMAINAAAPAVLTPRRAGGAPR
jgi:hypothetical protein